MLQSMDFLIIDTLIVRFKNIINYKRKYIMEEHVSSQIHLTEEQANERVERAVSLFKSGFNCSQSVVAADRKSVV